MLTLFDEVGAAHGMRRARCPSLGHDIEPVRGPADSAAAPERIRGLEAFELGCSERTLGCCADDWMGTAQCTASPGSVSVMQYAASETSSSDSWAVASSNSAAGILMQTSLPSARTLRFWRDVGSPGAPGLTAGAPLTSEAKGTRPGSQLRALRGAWGGGLQDRGHGPRGGLAAAGADAATPSPSTPRLGCSRGGNSKGPSPGSRDEEAVRALSASPTQSDVEAALELMLTPPRQPSWASRPLPSPPTSPGRGADAGALDAFTPSAGHTGPWPAAPAPPSPRSGTPPARPRSASGLLAAARYRFKESVGAPGRSSEFGRALLRELDAINSSPQLRGKKASSTMPALHVGSVSPIRGGRRLAW